MKAQSKPGFYSGEYKTEAFTLRLTPTAKSLAKQIAADRQMSIADLFEKLLRGEISLNSPSSGEFLAS